MAEANGEGADQGEEGDAALDMLGNLAVRAKLLLEELEAFKTHLRAIKQEGAFEIAHFRSTVQSEATALERLTQQPRSEGATHIARSSNLPFLEQVWNQAKQSRQLVALHKRIYYNSPGKSLGQQLHHVDLGKQSASPGDRKAAVTVDLITDQGQLWTKVSLVTSTRLLFDLAKQGWQSEGSGDEDSALDEDDEDLDVPLVKVTKELCRAAQCYRVRTRTPRVRLVLPRIELGQTDEIDRIVEQCRAAGATVLCAEQIKQTPPLEDAVKTMAPDPFSMFTSIVNVDCTILLALVSEFSHAQVSKEPWFHSALQRQVEIEGNENLLPALLYPALVGHDLVCTAEAAKRMHEIVETIGTPSEKARTAVLLSADQSKSQQDLISEMKKLSAYDVPSEWRLPVRVVEMDMAKCQSTLPEEGLKASKALSDINRSVFLYGWANGITTVTSNRTVTKQIESELDSNNDLADSVFPHIWLCPTARSLVGKESRGAKKSNEGATKLPDPLRREEQRRNGLDVLTSREGFEVEDLRPNGYPCDEVYEAKIAARRLVEESSRSPNMPK